MFGVSADIVQTKDVEETRVKATAKIVAFIDENDDVSEHNPTIEYMGRSAIKASESRLKVIFSELNSNDFAPLQIGALLGSPYIVPVVFDPVGFMRHTAIFGQSGSGKSFSFAIVLEEMLAKTKARILVLDPNSDYTNFSILRTLKNIKQFSRRDYPVEEHESFSQSWKIKSDKFLQFSTDHAMGSMGRRLELSFSDLNRKTETICWA